MSQAKQAILVYIHGRSVRLKRIHTLVDRPDTAYPVEEHDGRGHVWLSTYNLTPVFVAEPPAGEPIVMMDVQIMLDSMGQVLMRLQELEQAGGGDGKGGKDSHDTAH